MAVTSKSVPNLYKNFIKNHIKVIEKQIINTAEKHISRNS